MIRPLVDIATFAGTVGPRLAAKRGPAPALLLRVLTPPLRACSLSPTYSHPG